MLAFFEAGRLNVQAVMPQLQGDATEQTPPDLPSYLFKERIVYLGMSLVPAVTELLLAELLYLQYDNPTRPIFMYINSAGVQKGGDKLGYESEAFAIYDTMKYIKPEVHTLCVGNAFGESAMLLAAGTPGKRGALPSSTIMLRQPMQRFAQMQASDIDIYRNELRKTKNEIVYLLGKHIGKTADEIERVIARPTYFNPYEAVDFGIIDRVLEPDDSVIRQVVRESSQKNASL
ncbi:g301 [Coccomyxa elongata]